MGGVDEGGCVMASTEHHKIDGHLAVPTPRIFGVKVFADELDRVIADYGINLHVNTELTSVDVEPTSGSRDLGLPKWPMVQTKSGQSATRTSIDVALPFAWNLQGRTTSSGDARGRTVTAEEDLGVGGPALGLPMWRFPQGAASARPDFADRLGGE
jgi:hypothetical protein